jgi:hypothetical protein
MIKPDEYQYFWESLDGKRSGGPYRTVAGLKSALQTSSCNIYWDAENKRYRSYAEDGVTISRAKISYEIEVVEEWKK